MISCIYKIENILNNKIYIGSSKNFKNRKTRHLRDLKNGIHHSIYLQRSYNKHGINNFIFKILEECDKEKLLEKEKYWIDKLKPSYNIGAIGGGDNYTNHPNKKEIYKKLLKNVEKALAAQKPTPSGKDNPNWRGGKKFFICPICKKQTGTPKKRKTKSCRKCMNFKGVNSHMFGKNISKESRNKMRAAKLGIANKALEKSCSINGVVYESATKASKDLKITRNTVFGRIRSKSEEFKDWFYIK